MHPAAHPCPSRGRRRALVLLVNAASVLVGSGLAALVGAFALRPHSGAAAERKWIRAGTTASLRPNVPAARVLSPMRIDGWYRARARETVFLMWDGGTEIRAMSARCTHLGCQVRWEAEAAQFRCPCHGGAYDAAGQVLEGPPPRPLDSLEARIDPASGEVVVRV